MNINGPRTKILVDDVTGDAYVPMNMTGFGGDAVFTIARATKAARDTDWEVVYREAIPDSKGKPGLPEISVDYHRFRHDGVIAVLTQYPPIDKGLGRAYMRVMEYQPGNVPVTGNPDDLIGGGEPESPDPATWIPQGLKLEKADLASVMFSWKNVKGAEYYHIYRSTQAGETGEKIGTAILPAFVDTRIRKGYSYYYGVSAVVNGQESETSQSLLGLNGAIVTETNGLVGAGAYVRWGMTTNAHNAIEVRNAGANYGRIGYAQFDASALAIRPWEKVTLELVVNWKGGDGITHAVYAIDENAWNPNAVLWTTSPNHAQNAYAVTGVGESARLVGEYAVPANGPVALDVTDMVKTWLADNHRTMSFMIVETSRVNNTQYTAAPKLIFQLPDGWTPPDDEPPVEPAAVPEPATALLFGVGIVLMLARLARKKWMGKTEA